MFDFVYRKTRSVMWAQIMIFRRYRKEKSELKKFGDHGKRNATHDALSLGEKQKITKKRPIFVEIAKPIKLSRFLISTYKYK